MPSPIDSESMPVLIDAVRTPIGKRGGGLSGVHAAELLGHVFVSLLGRSGLDAATIDQIITGCVSQVGEQALNVGRNAWLAAGLPYQVPSTTIDSQCGSSQQAALLATSMISAGECQAVIACGVESMSRIPLGASFNDGPGNPRPAHFPVPVPSSQFEAAERIATRRGLTRSHLDRFALWSHEKAATAIAEGRFVREIDPVWVDGSSVDTDEGPRSSSIESLSKLRPVIDGGHHTAATSSQVSDGAAGLLWMSQRRAAELGLEGRARVVAQTLVGADPYYYLDGPIDATHAVLARAGMSIDDIDVIEVNEAFASVALSWSRTFDSAISRVNVSGGAIALGHPVGATGARLITTALHEMERIDASTGLVSMCCGGALATATILERT